MSFTLKPSKTDQCGSDSMVKTFLVRFWKGNQSAGAPLEDILRNDPTDGDQEATPLFRHPETGTDRWSIGGHMVAGFLGLWSSESKFDYLYACR